MDVLQGYKRAARLYNLATSKQNRGVLNERPTVNFCQGRRINDFWYAKDIRIDENNTGVQYTRFCISAAAEQPLFCHVSLAVLLSAFTENAKQHRLPININDVDDAQNVIHFTIAETGREFKYNPSDNTLEALPFCAFNAEEATSPNKAHTIFIRDFNLHCRCNLTGKETCLTKDGREGSEYGVMFHNVSSKLLGRKRPLRPAVAWSPDSKYFLTYRNDNAAIEKLALYQSLPLDGTQRPKHRTFAYSIPGDEHILNCKLFVGNIEDASLRPVMLQNTGGQVALLMSMLFYGNEDKVRWTTDGKTAYMLAFDRLFKKASMLLVDMASATAKYVITDTYDTFAFTDCFGSASHDYYRGTNCRILNQTGEIIWHSEREGWSALYLHSSDGREIRRLTGDWVVRRLYYANEESRELYFAAAGRETDLDPYIQQIYKVHIDSGEITRLTHDCFEHYGDFSPDGTYWVDTFSDVVTAPVTVVRNMDGVELGNVVAADISIIQNAGYIFPEPFKALARDGKTPVYGVIFKPFDFNPSNKYPVVDYIYGGAQTINVPKAFCFASPVFADPNEGMQSLAQIGFVGIVIDGLATPLRQKSIHDMVYGKHEEACGLEDHIAVIKQLAKRHNWIDAERVGLYGVSGGGYATARGLLQFPDFFKVGFSMCGNHDQSIYNVQWGERWCGKYSKDAYAAQSNASIAANLKGKLYLVHGDLDENVHPASSIRLAAALIAANKTFDFLLYPNADHGLGHLPYISRLRWDYFVRHLLEVPPPVDFDIIGYTKCEEGANPNERAD